MIKIFWHLRKSSSMVEVSKYSIKSDEQFTCVQKLFWRVLKTSQKKTFAWATFQIKLQANSQVLLLKKAHLHVFSCKFCQKFKSTILAKHVWVTPSAKYSFVCHINLSHKMLLLTLISVLLWLFSEQTLLVYESPRELAMTELIYHW